jgi:hypothetical protein
MPGIEEVFGSAAGLNVNFGMLPDWRAPAGKKNLYEIGCGTGC